MSNARALRQYNSVFIDTLLPDQAVTLGLAKLRSSLVQLSQNFDATVYVKVLDLCDYFKQSSTLAHSVFSEIEHAVNQRQYTAAASRVSEIEQALRGDTL